MQTLPERRNLHDYLEQKAELAVQGECAAQRRFSEAEADMDIRNWEQRNSDIAPYETNRELESQRLELYQANQQADQAQDKRLSVTNEKQTLPRKSPKKFQEFEELRRICCEVIDRTRQLKIDELSMQQERNPTVVSQLLTQN